MGLRNEKSIVIGHADSGERVTVREIDLEDSLELFEDLHLFAKADQAGAKECIRKRRGWLIKYSDIGEKIAECGALAVMQLWDAFVEVNAPFLEAMTERSEEAARKFGKLVGDMLSQVEKEKKTPFEEVFCAASATS